MKITRFNSFFIFLVSLVLNASGQVPYGNPGEQTAVYKDSTAAPYGYYEYLPLDYVNDSINKYPLLIFFHGSAGSGNGNDELLKILKHGVPPLIERGQEFKAIIISPQSANYSFTGEDSKLMYDYIMQHYPVDSTRVYLTGLSSGGSSTWNALDTYGDKIAAAIPICGVTHVSDPSDSLLKTAIWAHHNVDDNFVDYQETVINVDRIANTGTTVMDSCPYTENEIAPEANYTMSFEKVSRTWSAVDQISVPTGNLGFTLYKEGGHNAWTKVYNNTVVWDWLFSQSIATDEETDGENAAGGDNEGGEETDGENTDGDNQSEEEEEETDDENTDGDNQGEEEEEEEEEETDDENTDGEEQGEEVAEEVERDLDKKFSYYPNPSGGMVYLNNINTKNSWVQIIAYTGKRLAEIPVVNTEQLIDLTQYGSGLYFLRIFSTTENVEDRVLKIIIN